MKGHHLLEVRPVIAYHQPDDKGKDVLHNLFELEVFRNLLHHAALDGINFHFPFPPSEALIPLTHTNAGHGKHESSGFYNSDSPETHLAPGVMPA